MDLRFSLSYRNVEELLTERGLPADHTTIWRWVQLLCARTEQALSSGNEAHQCSWRVDETYLRVAGKWTYLYRAVDSEGNTIDFFLSSTRDAHAAKMFLQKALRAPGHPRPRVINMDGNPSYPKVISELKQTAELGRRCRCRPVRYLNNIVEQDHREIKRRVNASQAFRSFHGARRTIQGYEAVHMIRKGQVTWLSKGDAVGLVLFINETLGLRGYRILARSLTPASCGQSRRVHR